MNGQLELELMHGPAFYVGNTL